MWASHYRQILDTRSFVASLTAVGGLLAALIFVAASRRREFDWSSLRGRLCFCLGPGPDLPWGGRLRGGDSAVGARYLQRSKRWLDPRLQLLSLGNRAHFLVSSCFGGVLNWVSLIKAGFSLSLDWLQRSGFLQSGLVDLFYSSSAFYLQLCRLTVSNNVQMSLNSLLVLLRILNLN